MNVAYDSRPASDPRGIGRYARCLLAALQELVESHAAGDGDGAADTIVETHRPRARRVDVYHSPWIDGALLRSPVPMVVTLHDLVPLKRRGEYLRTGMRFRLHYLAVQRAVRIIVPTHVVAADVVELLNVPEERVVVVPEAAASVMRPIAPAEVSVVRRRHNVPDDYLIWVGGMQHPDPRKRVAALARAERTLPLVLVGPASRWARELPDVHVTGEVDDDDLAALYTGARALVFPSDDEGFGLPPVEALACGTPVVACDVPAVREVVGTRATLVPVDDLDALMAAAEAAARPAPTPSSWTWDDAAAQTWDVYADALAAPRRFRDGRRRESDQDLGG